MISIGLAVDASICANNFLATMTKMQHQIYWIQVLDESKSPRAVSFGPLSDMPFFEGLDEYQKMSYDYWKLNPEKPGMDLDNVGSEWSDLISCLSSPSRFFMGQRIVETFEREAIPVLRKTVMPIAKIRSKRLRDVTPPTYYVVEANPGLSVDWSALGIVSGSAGAARWVPTKEQPFLIFEDSSWTGLDLFSLKNYMATSTLYCTERIKRLAETERWTNIGFVPIGVATADSVIDSPIF